MSSDKLPNYYDVLVEATEVIPKPTHDECYNYTLFVEGVLASDPQTAVKTALNDRWAGMCDIAAGDVRGWIVTNQDDDVRLELDVEDYGDCATPVPYERRLLLAGVRPLEFVQ